MVGNLGISSLSIDKPEYTEGRGWYLIASFYIEEKRRILGLSVRTVVYTGDELSLLVCAPSVNPKEDIQDIDPAYFEKKLVLPDPAEGKIVEYITGCFREACNQSANRIQVFKYLEKYFYIDD